MRKPSRNALGGFWIGVSRTESPWSEKLHSNS